MSSKRVLAIDPGLATGLAKWWGPSGEFESSIEPYPLIETRLEQLIPFMDAVACETFTISARTAQLTRQNEPIELIGVVKYLCRKRKIPLIMQSPSDAKSFVPNARLKTLGWYKPGAGHDNDAARHLLLYFANHETPFFKELMTAELSG